MSDATVSFGSKLVRFGPFEYELETGILRRNGADVAVPRRAAHILARLLERPGELVSKEDLLEAGWPGVAVSDQSLNEAVKVLRRILEDDSREPTYIQTVYGRGLRFLAPVRPVKAPRTSQSRRLKIAGAVGAALGLFLFYHFRGEPNVAPETLKPTIAILPFENEGDDPSLDWLRLGIAGLLATDLSQSTEIAVTPTARLMPIVRGLNLSDDAARSEVASRAGAGTVVWGSFVKDGEILRVTMRVEDLVRGGNLETHEVEGIGDSSLFSMVEKLTHLVKVDLGLSARADTRLDRHLRDVTTSSVEAYRLYAEGMQLRFQTFRFEDAILFLEKAVAIDPGFALALAQLGIWHGNLSRPKEMEAYLAEAVQHLDRVTTRERYYIEACYYSTREITIAKEIEAYRRLLELYPEDIARHNLANCYAYLERFPEAIEELEEVRRRGLVVHNYELAHAYASLGQIDRGLQALEDALSFHANRWEIHRNIGLLHTWAGRYEEAVQAFDRADVLSPGEEHIAYGRWEIAALRGEWEDAGAYAGEMTLSAEPYWTWRGFRSQAWNHLYRGRSADALDSLERAALAYGDDGPFSGFARSLKSHVLVETAQLEKAIEEARRAQELGEGHVPEWQGLFFEGLAQARLGRFEDARKTAQKLRRRTEPIPGNREKRRWHHLSGEIALAAGEHEQAIGELEKARSLLPPRGLHWPRGRLNDHVPVWYSLASAYVAAGDEEEALHFFSRIAESGYEHLYWPIPYVRSLSFLASIHENRGELEKARKLRERFANYWGVFTDMTSLPLPERSTATQ